MSILVDILAFIGFMAIVVIVWWIIIEAQEDIPGINEPNNKGGTDLHANPRKQKQKDR